MEADMANRLAAESSPYLRQHADNPVDWYPWSDVSVAASHFPDDGEHDRQRSRVNRHEVIVP